ncbi:MAG TPA: hypothetical protein DEA90_09170 [Opitutae bacterium]|nr:hypothetical protein [Puniceicoccaceae bacterium]HBR94319.1 hypothetical protein [Opitutae bacterium]
MDAFKDWSQAACFFGEQAELLGGHELRLSWHAAFERVCGVCSSTTDRAVRSYIAKREWPVLEDTDRLELLLRLQCARWYCADLNAKDPLGQLMGLEDCEATITRLLIDYWRGAGRLEWLGSLE